jgi:hypothetical protein
MGVWPANQNVVFEIPAVLKESIEKFTTFYQHRHNGRRLSFLLGNSRGEVVGLTFGKKYTFIVSFQYSTTSLFLQFLGIRRPNFNSDVVQ